MRLPKVSVIVPVYNVEEYLDDCLTSISNQSESNIEILIINDGSLDNSLEVAKRHALLDQRIRIFNNDNHGVSYCRNYGIKEAKSDWIMFVDADDWLPFDSIEVLYSFVAEDVQVICGGYEERRENDEDSSTTGNNQPTKITDINILKGCCIVNPKTHRSIYKSVVDYELPSLSFVWGKMYRRQSIIDSNIFFDERLKWGEDQKFNLEFIQSHHEVVCFDKCIYNYRIRISSSSRKWSNSSDEYIQYAFYIHELVNDNDFLVSMWQLKRFEVIMNVLSLASMEKMAKSRFLINEIKRFLRYEQYKEVVINEVKILNFQQRFIQHLLRNGMIKITIMVFRIRNTFLRAK